MISQGAGSYQCAAHARRSLEGAGAGGLKRGVSAAAGTVNQRGIFNGSDLDEPPRLTPT